MNKGTHFNGQPMYGQLINLLDKEEILKFSRKYHGERYVKHFDAYQHLTVMLYAVIKRSDPLREITDPCFLRHASLPILAYARCPDAAHCLMPMRADQKRRLRTYTAAFMPATRANFHRTAENGRYHHGSTACK